MKYVAILFSFLFSLNVIQAQVFDVETLKLEGTNDTRINIVILSEGYQTSEFGKFKTDAESFVSDMFMQSPFAEYSNYFNVHIIYVPSNESGADHPGTATNVSEPHNIPVSFVDTYFNATFDAFGFHRFLYYGIDFADAASADLKINSVLTSNFPSYDQALILVNSDEYGGTGGEFPISSTGAFSNEIAIHELGHALFDLKDEYELPDVFYGEAINMTQEDNVSAVKWKNWINKNGVAIYPYGTSGTSSTWYRPHQNCKMRYLNSPFCSVCKEGIIEKIHSLISPIASYEPLSNTLSASSFPLQFQLDLIKPEPNTLHSIWTLNNSNFENDVDGVSILEADLIAGINTLTTVVSDNTTFVNVDNHSSLHVYTITWTIENSTLGTETIKSELNDLSITLFPNPSRTFINFKMESNADASLKVDLVSIDGKRLKTLSLTNYKEEQMDVSALSKGLYLANFYANNVFVASKKLVKN